MHIQRASFLSSDWLRQPLRAVGAAVLLLGVVAVVAVLPTRAAFADPKAVPHTTGAPFTSHNAPGFPGTRTTAPFNECPQIGYDASCGLLISVSNNGEQVQQDNNNQATGVAPIPGQQMPFDNIDDTLVGIVNNFKQADLRPPALGHVDCDPALRFRG